MIVIQYIVYRILLWSLSTFYNVYCNYINKAQNLNLSYDFYKAQNLNLNYQFIIWIWKSILYCIKFEFEFLVNIKFEWQASVFVNFSCGDRNKFCQIRPRDQLSVVFCQIRHGLSKLTKTTGFYVTIYPSVRTPAMDLVVVTDVTQRLVDIRRGALQDKSHRHRLKDRTLGK